MYINSIFSCTFGKKGLFPVFPFFPLFSSRNGIKIDNKLDLNNHVPIMYKKANLKLHALARLSRVMNKDTLRLLMKAFVESQFS